MTEREQKILSFMQEEIRKNGFPPTVREICAALSIKSTSTVHAAIASLAEQGLIQKGNTNKRRALTILEDGKEEIQNNLDVVNIPVIGRVAAGTPILAEQNIEDSFPLPSRYVGRGNSFMLTVHGDSMIGVGIYDGDYIVVEECKTANNGDIVVAMIDGLYDHEATVKTFYKEDGHIRLQPENPDLDPIIVPDCTIVGKVKGVFRYFN